MKKKEKCEGLSFAMSPKTHLNGCGCPECAISENITSNDEYLQSVLDCLEVLLEEGRIIVYDPKSRRCLSDDDVKNVCINGNAIQIGLSPDWMKN